MSKSVIFYVKKCHFFMAKSVFFMAKSVIFYGKKCNFICLPLYTTKIIDDVSK